MDQEKDNLSDESQKAQEKIDEDRRKEEKESLVRSKRRKSSLDFGKLLLGLSIIFAGALLLARSTGILPGGWDLNIFHLWPVLVIALGLSFLDTRNPVVFAVALAVFLGVLALIGTMVWDGNYRAGREMRNMPFEINRESNVNLARVQIRADVGDVRIGGGAVALAEGSFRSNYAELKSVSVSAGRTQDVRMETAEASGWNLFRADAKNVLEMNLDSELPMELSFDFDVVNGRIDLSDIMAKSINIRSDVSDLELIMSDKMDMVDVDINSNVGQLTIIVPQSLGVRAIIESGISSEDLSGFEKTGEKEYKTSNYDAVAKRAEINLDVDISEVKIERR